MDISVKVSQADVDRLKRAYDRWHGHELVQERIQLNVGPNPQAGKVERLWEVLALALTTSQQRSGPGTRIYTLWSTEPCPLSTTQFDKWKPDVATQAASFLKSWGGIRCYNNIGLFMEHNHRLLFTDGGWKRLQPSVQELTALMASPGQWDERALAVERLACKRVAELGLKGIGNKQCRNWLMNARLLRYELPLDSRVLKFLKPIMTTLPLEQDLLFYESYYLFVEDLVHALCRQAGLLPCVADAVMFLSADGDA